MKYLTNSVSNELIMENGSIIDQMNPVNSYKVNNRFQTSGQNTTAPLMLTYRRHLRDENPPKCIRHAVQTVMTNKS